MMLRVALNRKTPSYAHSKAVGNGLLPPFAHQVAFSKLSRVQLFVTPWTIQSMEFSRPEYWSG